MVEKKKLKSDMNSISTFENVMKQFDQALQSSEYEARLKCMKDGETCKFADIKK